MYRKRTEQTLTWPGVAEITIKELVVVARRQPYG